MDKTSLVNKRKRPSGTYKWCFVPLCKNTSVSSPSKVFVSVPVDPKRRRTWINAVRRYEGSSKLSPTSGLFCCEDHFNMEEDMENWMRYKMIGGKLRSKATTVPHIFLCQPQRAEYAFISSSPIVPQNCKRSASVKLESFRLITQALASSSTQEVAAQELSDCSTIPQQDALLPTSRVANLSPDRELELTTPVPSQAGTRDIGVQARPIKFRSKETQCHSGFVGSSKMVHAQTSPIKLTSTKRVRLDVDAIFSDSSTDDDRVYHSDANFSFDTSVSTGNDSSEEEFNAVSKSESMKKNSLIRCQYLCRKQSQTYIGLPPESLFIVDLLAKCIIYRGLAINSSDIVLLILRKIRLNESFLILGNEFGISKSHACRVFGDYVKVIAGKMKELIVWPGPESIHRLLPTCFQAKYSNVQSIIDCFEIEIEKPTNSLFQALTWSDYKKCNTLKYLVSFTPDGLINFISEGYGGRVSDMVLLEDCGYLDKLPQGIQVMADRGFKGVEQKIIERNCSLVRLPIVTEGVKLSANQCKETKRIASLRIHVERLIRKIREFHVLSPHACVDIHILGRIDSCVDIAAGLVNLQSG